MQNIIGCVLYDIQITFTISSIETCKRIRPYCRWYSSDQKLALEYDLLSHPITYINQGDSMLCDICNSVRTMFVRYRKDQIFIKHLNVCETCMINFMHLYGDFVAFYNSIPKRLQCKNIRSAQAQTRKLMTTHIKQWLEYKNIIMLLQSLDLIKDVQLYIFKWYKHIIFVDDICAFYTKIDTVI